jgi:amidase
MPHRKPAFGLAFDRRELLRAGLASGAVLAGAPLAGRASAPPPVTATALATDFPWEEASIGDLAAAMSSQRTTALALTEAYLARIEAIDRRGPTLRAVIEVNPDARAIAAELDRERAHRGPRGPLHGIPVLLKDNLDTADRMATSAGSLALADHRARRDSTVAARLRAAGAVILGKTNLSEWANFRGDHSISGWSGRGGLTRLPYVLDRNACGSSSGSGVAVAANLCAAAIGTETDGSVVCPATHNGIVGLKPTLGLVSRAGIIPIAHSQDTAGPMTRTVRDVALLLGAIAGADPRDSATAASAGHVELDYTRFLNADGLAGSRLGVVRNLFRHRQVDPLFTAAVSQLRALGAEIVDDLELAAVGEYDAAELEVLLYEFRHDLDAYLADTDPSLPARTLAELIAWNERHADRELPYFGQELFARAQAKGPLTDQAYRDALSKCKRLAAVDGIDALLAAHRLDALVSPTGGPAWPIDLINGDHYRGSSSSPAAVAGYPHITVPMGFVGELPVGLSLFASAWSEGTLLRLAHAFEQATQHRRPPRFLPTASLP